MVTVDKSVFPNVEKPSNVWKSGLGIVIPVLKGQVPADVSPDVLAANTAEAMRLERELGKCAMRDIHQLLSVSLGQTPPAVKMVEDMGHGLGITLSRLVRVRAAVRELQAVNGATVNDPGLPSLLALPKIIERLAYYADTDESIFEGLSDILDLIDNEDGTSKDTLGVQRLQ